MAAVLRVPRALQFPSRLLVPPRRRLASAALARFPPSPAQPWRPGVTLAYAQSLDGCVAICRGAPTALSGEESLRLTHELRARHDAILVGVGTVLADDPQLSTRLVTGPSPRPVVLDACLRTPPQSRLLWPLARQQRCPVVLCDEAALQGVEVASRAAALRAAGAEVIGVDARASAASVASERVPKPSLPVHGCLRALSSLGVVSVMVEGGAAVIRSFLAAGVVDELCVTSAPVYLRGGPGFARNVANGEPTGQEAVTGGVGAGNRHVGGGRGLAPGAAPSTVALWDVVYEQHGDDVALFAKPKAPEWPL